RSAARRADPPGAWLRAGSRAALRPDQGGVPGRSRWRTDRRHRLSLRGDPGGTRAGPEAAGDLGKPGKPLALPAVARRSDAHRGLRQSVSIVIFVDKACRFPNLRRQNKGSDNMGLGRLAAIVGAVAVTSACAEPPVKPIPRSRDSNRARAD